MIPGEQQATPNFGSLPTTVPVSAKTWRILLWKPPVANRGLLRFKHRASRSRQLGSNRSFSVIYTLHLCDDNLTKAQYISLMPGSTQQVTAR